MLIIMFPGQGAQRLSMGEDLFGRFPQLTAEASDILGYSISDLCLYGPIEKLTQTQYTQPALFVVNSLQYLAFIEDTGEKPDFLMGHSVGEYAALFASGVIDFASGVRLVEKRGSLMANAHGGGMAAVIGLSADKVTRLISRENLSDIYPANFNTPKQIVVSGKKESILAAESAFQNEGALLYKVLAVSGAFHSPFMKPFELAFEEFAAGIEFKKPEIPVISNVTARPHIHRHIRSKMTEQITAPVKWSESIRYLLSEGADVENFKEIGPKGPPILLPMVKRTAIEAGPLNKAETNLEQKRISKQNATHFHPRKEKLFDDQKENKLQQINRSRAAPQLGSIQFCEAFHLSHPYIAGAMYRGISSVKMVAALARAGMLSFFGAGGLPLHEIDKSIATIKSLVSSDQAFGVNFISHFNRPQLEEELTDILLKHEVSVVEASAFMEVSPALIRYRAMGLKRRGGLIEVGHRVVAKVSRPDIAAHFLSPPPEKALQHMLLKGILTREHVDLLRSVPMADAITVEADSGGHTDHGNLFNLLPAILKVRNAALERFENVDQIFIGAGGGIGTPEAAAAAFMLGADYIVTGSMNQCTVEAGTSDAVKDLLSAAEVHDTVYAPSGAMFELGSKIQVLKKGLFFPSRAEKLVSLYHQSGSLEDLEPRISKQIQDRYLKCSFEDVLEEIKSRAQDEEIRKIESNPKYRFSKVIRRYYSDTSQWALSGNMDHKVDFQIHCGPALGAVNQWLKGSEFEDWRHRQVAAIGEKLLHETADVYAKRFKTAFQ
jgi:trans-AT polyketide synthase/acyltransferase/oxidoreductase domain-containing protein